MSKTRWIERFGFVAVGVCLADLLHGGWAAVITFGLGYMGRWLLYQILSVFFGVELQHAKALFIHHDPVKRAIWTHHSEDHPGRWRHCQRKSCTVI